MVSINGHTLPTSTTLSFTKMGIVYFSEQREGTENVIATVLYCKSMEGPLTSVTCLQYVRVQSCGSSTCCPMFEFIGIIMLPSIKCFR